MRTFRLLSIFALLCCVSSLHAYDFMEGGLAYKINSDSVTVRVTYKAMYTSYTGDIVVPESVTHNGTTYMVTEVGSGAFGYITNIEYYDGDSIPMSFRAYTTVTSVTLPTTVTKIGEAAFAYCNGLTHFEMPNSVTIMYSYAFAWCENLQQIKLSESLEKISGLAFYYCKSLSGIEIPASVAWVSFQAFMNCPMLSEITVDPANTVYDSRNNCNAIINTATNGLVIGGISTVIPDGVVSIGEYAFMGRTNLTTINLPESITSIAYNAFSGCSNLESIYCYITRVFEISTSTFSSATNATLYVPRDLVNTYKNTAGWNEIPTITALTHNIVTIASNNKGTITVNGAEVTAGDIVEVQISSDANNTFVFTPRSGYVLYQVLVDGLDVTASVEDSTLVSRLHEGAKLVVVFSEEAGDVNGDGGVNIEDVTTLITRILSGH